MASALACLSICARASAEAAPDSARPAGYYVGNLSAAVLLAGGGLLIDRLLPPRDRHCDFDGFPGDTSLRGNHSQAAGEVSDVLLYSTLTEPLVASLASFGFHARAANQGVVYGQVLSATFALNSLTKLLFPRARPYSYSPRLKDFNEGESDYDVSFYSGHASAAFAGAVAASYLYSEGAPDRGWARHAVWSTEFALAASTATLRVRAGKHYYSDVLLGALIGASFGTLIPLAHGAQYLPKVGDYVAGASGIAIGIATGALLPFHDDGGGRVSGWSVSPLYAGSGSVGIQTSGTW
ncbi:MAG: phosphatase PAP2 family protein [Polyangiaceae bacterium]